MLKQLKGKDLPALREEWWEENGKKCLITGLTIPLSEAVMDHQHKLKSDLADESGPGCCRGVLSFQGNAWEGKVTNSFRRLGLNKKTDIVTALRNLAAFLECNHVHTDEVVWIHPSEEPKALKITKRCYNKLLTAIKKDKNAKGKVPKYTGRFSKPLEKLMDKYEIEIEYYESFSC